MDSLLDMNYQHLMTDSRDRNNQAVCSWFVVHRWRRSAMELCVGATMCECWSFAWKAYLDTYRLAIAARSQPSKVNIKPLDYPYQSLKVISLNKRANQLFTWSRSMDMNLQFYRSRKLIGKLFVVEIMSNLNHAFKMNKFMFISYFWNGFDWRLAGSQI